MKPGEVVVIGAFDEVPEHLFRIETVEEDHVTGVALTGPLAGAYGEPDLSMIIKGFGPDEAGQGT